MTYKNREFRVWARPSKKEIKIRQGKADIVIDVTQFGALVKAIGLCADEIFLAEKNQTKGQI